MSGSGHGIPEGTYELKIGESFLQGYGKNRPELNTLRFDFKPASIASGSETYIAQSQNDNEFQVIVPGEGQKPTIFKGAKKAIKGDKECLLVYNKATKELCLERVSASVNLKKTRETEMDERVKKEVERLRKKLRIKQESKERTISESTVGEEDDGAEDEDVSALEKLVESPSSSTSAAVKRHTNPQKQPSPTKKSASFVSKKSILAEDLQLSESSSENE